MVSFRIDEDDFSRLDTFAQQTSCSRAEVLRRSEVCSLRYPCRAATENGFHNN
jgi:predicted transcriptional regulator